MLNGKAIISGQIVIDSRGVKINSEGGDAMTAVVNIMLSLWLFFLQRSSISSSTFASLSSAILK